MTFIVSRYWPATGGVESHMRSVVNDLASRHDVTVLAYATDESLPGRLTTSLRPGPTFQPFDDGAARVEPVTLTRRQRARLIPQALQVLPGTARLAYGRLRAPLAAQYARAVGPILAERVSETDVVHVWSADLVGAAAVRAARLLRRPSVITPFVHPGQWGEDPGSVRTYRRADRVVALLGTERDAYVRLGVRPDRVAVSGVCSPGIVLGGGAAIRERHRISGPLVLFLGVRRSYKGHDVLLAAAPRVAEACPGTTFAFVGPGDPIEPDGHGARVIDAGRVSDEERAAWLDAADVFCLPSAHEIFPVSILEAWSAHTAVVVSELPPLVELMARSYGGVTVPRTADAFARTLVDVLRDDARRDRLAAAGHRFWIAEATPQAVARRHEQIYEELLSAP